MQPNINQMANTSYQQGQNLQNLYNTQAQGAFNQYQGAQSNAYNTQNQLLDYNRTMANPQDLYNSALTGAQQMYGFNPADLAKAQHALAVTNTTMANLPEAIRQQGNYYGTTAGSEANNFAQQSGVLQGVQQGQANTVGQYQALVNATQNQALQGATLGFQGEQLKSQNLQAVATNAIGIMQTAQQQMVQLATLAQQQGYLTAQQQSQYASAQNSYASAQQAVAQVGLLNAQAEYQRQQTGLQNKVYQGSQGNGLNSFNLQKGINSGALRLER